jgi:hypothetical protein
MCGGLINIQVGSEWRPPWGAMKLRETPTAPEKEGTNRIEREKGTLLDSLPKERTGWIPLPLDAYVSMYVCIMLTPKTWFLVSIKAGFDSLRNINNS